MSVEVQEYLDEPTGVRLTVESEHPYSQEAPRVTAYLPEPCTLEPDEFKAAIQRLLKMSGRAVSSSEQAPQGEQTYDQK